MFYLFGPTFYYLISKNFCYDATQQYRYFNFSDMFRLNCIFVIDAAVKQLVSRNFFDLGVSVVATAWPHTKIKKKSIQIFTARCIKVAVVPKRGSEWRGGTPRLSAWATQLRRNVAAVASRWQHWVRSDQSGN